MGIATVGRELRLLRERDEWKARAEAAAAEERGKVVEHLRRRAQWLHREYLTGGHPALMEREAECKSLAELIAKGRHEDPRHLGDPA